MFRFLKTVYIFFDLFTQLINNLHNECHISYISKLMSIVISRTRNNKFIFIKSKAYSQIMNIRQLYFKYLLLDNEPKQIYFNVPDPHLDKQNLTLDCRMRE